MNRVHCITSMGSGTNRFIHGTSGFRSCSSLSISGFLRRTICNYGGDPRGSMQTSLHRSLRLSGVSTGRGARNFRFSDLRGVRRLSSGLFRSSQRKGAVLYSQRSSSNVSSLGINDDSKLIKAIVYESNKQFCNAKGKSSRFSDFLASQLDSYVANSDPELRKTIISLSEDVRSYSQMTSSERLQLLDRVAQIQGFSSTKDLIDHQNAVAEASQNLQADTVCAEIPSKKPELRMYAAITYGSSEPIALYSPRERLSSSPPADADSSYTIAAVEQKHETMQAEHDHEIFQVQAEHDHQALHEEQNHETMQAEHDQETSRTEETLQAERQSEVKIVQTRATRTRQSAQPQAAPHDPYPTLVSEWKLDTPLAHLKCFTSYQKSQLQDSGFYSARSLLNHFPRSHITFESPTDALEDGQCVALFGTVVGARASKIKNALVLLDVTIKCNIGQDCLVSSTDPSTGSNTVFIHAKRFFQGPRFANYWFLKTVTSNYPEGLMLAVSGKVKTMTSKDHFEMKDPEMRTVEGGSWITDGKAYPVYPSKGLLQPKKLQQLIKLLLADLPENLDPLPDDLREKYQVYNLNEAYLGLHCPDSMETANLARRRFVFDDFFYLQLAFLSRRENLTQDYESKLLNPEEWAPMVAKVVRTLPFKLTDGQVRAASEIMWDLRQQSPMSRLLQGDVGCGKTVVAFLALLEMASSGYQGALMVPTEVVASQHYNLLHSWLEFLDEKERPRIAILTGSSTTAAARQIREGLANKEIDIVIGTHTLIAEKTKFPALGLAVIDEQHRFGVAQRERLKEVYAAGFAGSGEEGSKSLSISHVLLMTATPIPRSLALTLHGDMSLSQITELPPERLPVTTYVLPDDEKCRKRAYEMVEQELSTGGRAFIIYSLVVESAYHTNVHAACVEFEKLAEQFKEYKCGLVHGRMRPDVRNEELRKFGRGETQVLASTTVIEVGIDIPAATIIMVENAETYGVAQLHQLRGRVGRGKRQATCILLSSSEGAMERLKLLESTNDGFKLAEADLRMRGPGELLGKRQAGSHSEFVLARLGEDGDILEEARAAAIDLLRRAETNLNNFPSLKQEINIRQPPVSWS